jgi:hypothetical protein
MPFYRIGFALPNPTPSGHSLDMSGYHIFETLFDGVGIWLMCVTSFEEAIRQAEQLATRTKHEIRVVHRTAVVATLKPHSRAA